MSWRIHLANQAIQNLHVIPSKPPILAVWTRRNRVHYYDFTNGRLLSEMTLPAAPTGDRTQDAWQAYLAQLVAPETHHHLPYVRAGNGTDIYSTDDGKLHLYCQSDDRLFIATEANEAHVDLGDSQRLISVDLDRALGTMVGLDDACRLHVYQQQTRVGVFDIGLTRAPDLRPTVVVSRGGGNVYATDGQRVVATNTSGQILTTREMHYYIGRMTCSPGGGMVITTDVEAGVMRVYRGEQLTLTHQKFAIDLVAAANQVQLLADLPPVGTSVSALTAYNRGAIGFAMSGVVCVTNVEFMDEIPRPKALS
jgi:hypothetical protein